MEDILQTQTSARPWKQTIMRPKCRENRILLIANKFFQNVAEFEYLGTTVTN
jgi:hypothetical protein